MGVAMVNDVAPLPDYPDPYGLLCAILQDATVEWRGEITWPARTREELDARLGPEVMTWRARPGGQTIGTLILHMIGAELFWFERFALGREITDEDRKVLMSNEIDVDEGIWPDPPAQPASWYFDLHDRYRARTLEAIKEWPSADSMKEHDGWPRSMRWVLGHVIQHESYHGGQIVLLYDLWKCLTN